MTYQEIIATAMRQSAADCSCSEEDFRRNANVVTESLPNENASRYMTVPHICALYTYGTNVVASCRADLIPEVTTFLNQQTTAYRCFDTPAIYELNRILEKADAQVTWMHNAFLPDPDLIYGTELPCAYGTRELHPEDFADLYVPEWSNALCKDRKELDMLGIGAYDGGRLIGLAACYRLRADQPAGAGNPGVREGALLRGSMGQCPVREKRNAERIPARMVGDHRREEIKRHKERAAGCIGCPPQYRRDIL